MAISKNKLVGGLVISGLLVGGYALYRFILAQTNLLAQYSYKFVGARLRKLTKEQVSFEIDLDVTNNSSVEALIKELFLKVYVDNTYVGNVTSPSPFIVKANGTYRVTLKFEFIPSGLKTNIINIIFDASSQKDLPLEFKGYASIESGKIKSDLPIKYSTTFREYFEI